MDKPFQFDYAQSVKIVASAPAFLMPGSLVAVVGMTRLSGKREIAGMICDYGTAVYVVEYENGHSVEVPEQYLEALPC